MKGNAVNLFSKRHAKIAGAIIAAGALVATPAIAELIGAGDLDGTPRVMLAGGSDTTYAAAVKLDALYNEAPGCYQTVNSGASLSNFGKCVVTGGTTPTTPPALSDSVVNPQHDVVSELFPIGSGNGIKQLLDGGATAGVPALSFARSSRSLAAGNETKYLNSTAFAADGISWFHFTKISNKTTAHAALKTLTLAQLAGVYKGAIKTWNELMPTDKVLGVMAAYTSGGKPVKAGVNNGNPETDLSKLYVTYAPIKVFMAQDGSGTRSTWDSGVKAGDATYSAAAQVNDANGNCVNFCRIFENNASAISATDAPNAFYYFSYGRYTQRNTDLKLAAKVYTPGAMVGNSTGQTNWADALGQIAGTDVTPTTILAKTFPINRFLYLITKQNPAATVKNYVNFLCSASMETAKGANGLALRPQIEAALKAEGFVPLTKALDGGLDNNPAQSYCKSTVATG
jgi:ABC-type phosphate transport system substrate-binding protein